MSLGLNCCGGRARLRYSPGPEYLMGTGIKSGNERRVVWYGLRSPRESSRDFGGYNFSTDKYRFDVFMEISVSG